MPRYVALKAYKELWQVRQDQAESVFAGIAVGTEAECAIIAFALNSVADGYQLAAIDPAKAFHFVSEYHDGCLYYEGPTEGVRS